MKKLFLILVLLFALLGVVSAGNDIPVTMDQLPAGAQKFIKSYFPKSEVSFMKMEKDWLEKQYDVIFTNGDKLEFDNQGNWTEVDCKYTALPEGIVPKPILDYVAKNHPHTKIVQIERERKYYEIELTNGIELKFNSQFRAIEIDH